MTEIKTWHERYRANLQFGNHVTPAENTFMQAEIDELRAALAASKVEVYVQGIDELLREHIEVITTVGMTERDAIAHRWKFHKFIETYTAKQVAIAVAKAVPQWISVDDRLPECTIRDDTPVSIGNKMIPPMNQSVDVLVNLRSGSIRIDNLCKVDGDGEPFFEIHGDRVTHWMPLPAAPTVPLDTTDGDRHGYDVN